LIQLRGRTRRLHVSIVVARRRLPPPSSPLSLTIVANSQFYKDILLFSILLMFLQYEIITVFSF
jgi:hypothetical protein